MAALSQPQRASYDAIVIGAGIQGSFAAYHLAQRHRDTLLLEQVLASPTPPCPQPHRMGTGTWLHCARPRAVRMAQSQGVLVARPQCPQCQDPGVPNAKTPMFPIPGLPYPQCHDPHVPSAKTPVFPVPGPLCPQ